MEKPPRAYALRSFLKLITAIFFFAVWAGAQQLSLGSQVAKAEETGAIESYCSSLTGGYRVCRSRTSEDGDARFVVEKGDAAVATIDNDFWSMANAEPDQFAAYRGDLDGDGSAEIVLVVHDGTSNGMGVSYSTVNIFDGKTLGSGAKPLSFTLQEFGRIDSFVYNPASKRTEVMISYWAEYDSIEPKRIPGVYLVGKWFRYRNGRLTPSLERPTRVRRFLDRFASERNDAGFEHRTPNAWLNDRRAIKFLAEPRELTKPTRVEFGKITNYREADGANNGSEFEFVTDDGRTLAGTTDRGASSDGEAPPFKIGGFGIWRNRYLFPMSWGADLRLSVHLENVTGRRVRIEFYKSESAGKFAKIWLLD